MVVRSKFDLENYQKKVKMANFVLYILLHNEIKKVKNKEQDPKRQSTE